MERFFYVRGSTYFNTTFMKTKLLVLSLVALLAGNAAVAQFEQGTTYVAAGSNLGFSSSKTDGPGDALNSFNIGGKVGGFVSDNFLLGALIDYEKLSQGSSDLSITTLGFFGRFYGDSGFFLGAGYNSSKAKVDGNSGTAVGSIPIEIGYAAFIRDALTIEPSLSYALGTGDVKTNTLGINLAFGIYLGKKGE